jgi:hypothetical protein
MMCAICRGVKKVLKRPELCGKTEKTLQNREIAMKNLKNLLSVCIKNDQYFIQQRDQQNDLRSNLLK